MNLFIEMWPRPHKMSPLQVWVVWLTHTTIQPCCKGVIQNWLMYLKIENRKIIKIAKRKKASGHSLEDLALCVLITFH